ncbi:uncharacterized protein TRAVEDRAFT_67844 [Trametes versicolor FP-101664 SS1]|uniref:uncharacterized protein n=1 Tax=Trametes versicolor (strain FP-101664) TaxID=717944 RepID=UPI0004622CA5|nr:uncharacterized protein TRAVEDRAFT_67844 [Trametes versicolor FP-101664 SS1]EIW63872.1 hypothetical protein TRAVEDRAFT_67844 [Trametes versicolor FP-101664 SS1]
MLSATSKMLARTSSASSVCSDDSVASTDTTISLGPADAIVEGPKRTRKRFTTLQLIMLEHLYHKASHPTREQREQLAKDAEIDVRSVTVWFQNKRQTDRRIHRQLSEPVSLPLHLQPCSSPAPSSALTPSSPFSDASGKTIHTARARTRTLSGNSAVSTASLPAMGLKRAREHDHDRRSVRHKPSRLLSLDAIAARTERPVLLPRTPPQCLSSSPAPASARPHTPEPLSEDEPGGRALWENMQSSPAAPEPAKRTEKDLVRYGRRKYTLEYACAKEMVGGKKGAAGRQKEKKGGRSSAKPRTQKGGPLLGAGTDTGLDVRGEGPREREDDQEVPVLEWDADMHGDTDTEGVPSEAVTPSSSFGIGGLSVADDCEKENVVAETERAAEDALKRKMETQASTRSDADLMDVAYVLCGLSQRC